MKQTDQQADEAFRDQCRRQMERPLAARIKYGFNRVKKPVLDDAPWRSFNSMAEYRAQVAKLKPGDDVLFRVARHGENDRVLMLFLAGSVPSTK